MRGTLLIVFTATVTFALGAEATARELHFSSAGQEWAYVTSSKRVYRFDEEEGEWKRQKTNSQLVKCLKRSDGCWMTEVFDDGSYEELGPMIVVDGRIVALDEFEYEPMVPEMQGPGFMQQLPPWDPRVWGWPVQGNQGGYPQQFIPPDQQFAGMPPQGGGDKQVLGGGVPSCGAYFSGKGPQTGAKEGDAANPFCKPF